MRTHVVVDGDCLSSLAEKFGFRSWRTIELRFLAHDGSVLGRREVRLVIDGGIEQSRASVTSSVTTPRCSRRPCRRKRRRR